MNHVHPVAPQSGIEELLRPLRGSVSAQLEGAWRDPLERPPLFERRERASFRFDLQVFPRSSDRGDFARGTPNEGGALRA